MQLASSIRGLPEVPAIHVDHQLHRSVENASTHLYPENPPKQTRDLVRGPNSLDTQLPPQYTFPAQKRVLSINPQKEVLR